MRTPSTILFGALFLLSIFNLASQDKFVLDPFFGEQLDSLNQTEEVQRISGCVTPWYYSNPMRIFVGKYSNLLSSLDNKNYKQIISTLESDASTSISALYVLAIRLYDNGLKDDACFWFYVAQVRASIFKKILLKEKIGGIGDEAFELVQSFNAFNSLAGIWINGHSFGDVDNVTIILNRLIDRKQYSFDYNKCYPNLFFCDTAKYNEISTAVIKSFASYIAGFNARKEEIYKARKENGIENLY